MTATCKSCGSQNASDSTFCTECGRALISQDPEVQRIQAELNNAREELELNEVKEKIDSISERLKEAEEHLSKLKSEDISASESNTLSVDEQRVKRLQMQLLTAQEIAELRTELRAELKVELEAINKKAARNKAELKAINEKAMENSLPAYTARNSISPSELGQVSLSNNPEIRFLVTQNLHTGSATIRKLMSDPDDEVRQAAERANSSYAKRERERIEHLINKRRD